MAQYSHSKLSTFEQCELKFKLKYIDKVPPPRDKTIEAFLGSCVHDTLEWLYTIKKNERRIPSIDEVIVYFSDLWQKDFKESIVVVKQNMKAKDYFEKGVQFILDYYMKHTPFEDNTIALEKRIHINHQDIPGIEGHTIIGFIDRLVHNPQHNKVEVHDYKTANSLPSKDKIDTDRQLALYAIAMQKEYGQDADIELIWHFLSFNQEIRVKLAQERIEKLKESIVALINKIESHTYFKPKQSILCDWCEYKDVCPVWNTSQFTPEDLERLYNIEKAKELQQTLTEYPTAAKYIKE